MNQQLYDQLIEAGNVIVQWEETEKTIRIYSDKIEEQNNTLEKARKDIKKEPKFTVVRTIFGLLATCIGGLSTVTLGFAILGGLLYTIVTGTLDFRSLLIALPILVLALTPFWLVLFVFAVILVIGISLLVSVRVSIKRHTKKATAKYENLKADFEEKNKMLEDEINRLREELDAFLAENKKHVEFLPVDYQTVHAVGFMLKAVQNLRADTLKEAINLYDQELKHLEAMAAAERQRLQSENMIYAMQLLNRNMESMSENQARANQILRSIDAVQTINMAHHW